jgi:hypothetical protein
MRHEDRGVMLILAMIVVGLVLAGVLIWVSEG